MPKLKYQQEHTGSYYAATANQHPGYPVLQGAQQADVCVIGAGFTGVATALTLADAIAGSMKKFDLFANMKHHRIPGSQWLGNQLIALGMLYYRLKDRL